MEVRPQLSTGKVVKLSMKHFKNGLLRDGLIGLNLMGDELDPNVDYQVKKDHPKHINEIQVLDWIQENGLVSEKDFETGVTTSTKKYKICGKKIFRAEHSNFPREVVGEIKENGSVMGNILMCVDFHLDGKGIYEAFGKNVNLRSANPEAHAMVLAGYGQHEGKWYFDYLNSHGEEFGEKGFAKVLFRAIDIAIALILD
ncbi:hypothetical protein Dimus_002721 [Dionaea muscipula]